MLIISEYKQSAGTLSTFFICHPTGSIRQKTKPVCPPKWQPTIIFCLDQSLQRKTRYLVVLMKHFCSPDSSLYYRLKIVPGPKYRGHYHIIFSADLTALSEPTYPRSSVRHSVANLLLYRRFSPGHRTYPCHEG